MKNILVVLSGFFPAKTYGGPPVSIDNLCSLLCNQYNFWVICSDHEMQSDKRLEGITEGWNLRSNCKVKYIEKQNWNYASFKRITEEVKPSIIYLNSLFSYDTTVPFLRIAKQKDASVLLAPRGELCKNAFKKKIKKIPYIMALGGHLKRSNVFFQSTSDEETMQAIDILHINPKKVFFLENVSQQGGAEYEVPYKDKYHGNFVFISRIQPKKNLLYAIELLGKINKKYSVKFDIYGPLEDKEYWAECENAICHLPSNVHVQYLGVLEHDRVGITFSRYHCFLFPTLSENYGHVIAEALLANCTVITSNQVPWTDMNESEAGWSLSLDNEFDFIRAIENILDMNNEEYNHLIAKIKQYIAFKLNTSDIKKSYIQAFNKMIGEK